MRKRRSDAKLFTLPEELQLRIAERDNLPLHELQMLLAAPEDEGGFGVGHVAITSISEFLRHWRTVRLRQRLRDGREVATAAVEQSIIEAGPQMDAAIMASLREWIFDSITRGVLDPKDAKGLVGLILKDRQQALDERKVSLLEAKASALDKAAEEVGKTGALTPETLARIRKEAGLG